MIIGYLIMLNHSSHGSGLYPIAIVKVQTST